jgi:glycosyltransferase involved in cell wall biosynthesis
MKQIAPAVSVVMPVFNAEKFLLKSVNSIINQSFEDFEFLIHDDGSSDRSLDILNDIANRDCRVKISSGKNQGIVHTLNLLISKARAFYIARMDADDVSMKTRF